MSIMGIDIANAATPLGVAVMSLIILAVSVYYGFKHLKRESELARINRELLQQITQLSIDLGKTQESYERVVNNLDQAQQQLIYLSTWLDSSYRNQVNNNTDK